MSSTLGRLRKLLNDPLLVRDGRKLTATPLAESLAKQVRNVLDQIESILADPADFHPARAERTFTIVASDVLSIVLLKMTDTGGAFKQVWFTALPAIRRQVLETALAALQSSLICHVGVAGTDDQSQIYRIHANAQ